MMLKDVHGARTKRLAVAILGSLAFIASPATGQLAPGRSGSSSVSYMGAEAAMAELAAFGRCYAKQSRAEALSLIRTKPSSREEALVYRKLFNNEGATCLFAGTTLSAPLAYVRGAIAEGLYRSGSPAPSDLTLPAPAVAEVRNLADAARCYASGHKDQVQALLATKPGSKIEYKAVSALAAEFAACLPAGVDFNFDATVIRFRLAEAQLRLGRVPAPQGS